MRRFYRLISVTDISSKNISSDIDISLINEYMTIKNAKNRLETMLFQFFLFLFISKIYDIKR